MSSLASQSQSQSQSLALAVQQLNEGAVVAHATEGVWGLACDPYNQIAVMQLLAIKEREVDKGLIVVGASPDMFADQLSELSPTGRPAVLATWPGPHTWVLPKGDYPQWITGGRETVACRVPGHEQARKLSELFGRTIVSTSANRAGEPALTEYQAVVDTFAEVVALVLPGEVLSPGQASQIHTLDGERLR